MAWTLTYRQRSNPHPLNIFFEFEGNLQECISRARKYCDVMGYIFHSVRPMIIDLDKEERRVTGNPE